MNVDAKTVYEHRKVVDSVISTCAVHSLPVRQALWVQLVALESSRINQLPNNISITIFKHISTLEIRGMLL